MAGLSWKRNADQVLDRRRRFLRWEMQDSVLANLPVQVEGAAEWAAFDRKWGTYPDAAERPFPSNEEIFERHLIGLQERSKAEDDCLPVVYSILDVGEGMVGGVFGKPMMFLHRPHGATFSKAETVITDYAQRPRPSFSLDNEWVQRLLSLEEYVEAQAGDRFAQHVCLTMDTLNFACEMRGSTNAYLDIYEHPEELRALMELGLDFNVRFQEAQMARIKNYADGCFVWLAQWAPFPRAVSLSVDAYVICSVDTYVQCGFEYQARLIEHFGHGLMHFHCHRADLAAEVAKLPHLALFQFGGDSRDPLSAFERLPEIRKAVGEVPIQTYCTLDTFRRALADRTLMPNVWYGVGGDALPLDEANRLMEKVRAYRA